MPDHDCMGVEPVKLASTTVWRSVCRCGASWQRPSKELAEYAWEAHWRREDALPRIAEMRDQLPKEAG